MKQTFIILLLLATSFLYSQKSLFYDIPKKTEVQDSSLLKIETYKLNDSFDSTLIQQDFYKLGLLNKIIMFKSDTVRYEIKYFYEKDRNVVEEIRYMLINNMDTIVHNIYFNSDKRGNHYYAVDVDSTNDKLLIRQFIHYEYDQNDNVILEHEFFYRDFSGYSTEGGKRKYEYDEQNRLKYISTPDYGLYPYRLKRSSEYIYNEANNLIMIQHPNRKESENPYIEYEYDKRNRLIKSLSLHDMTVFAKWLGRGSKWQRNTVHYIYNDLDKLIMIKDVQEQEFSVIEKHKIYYYE